ncbi:MAG: phosphotransferase family protein [Porticoccaceae bacterium]
MSDFFEEGLQSTRAVLEDWFARQMPEAKDVRVEKIDRLAGGSHELLDVMLGWRAEGVSHHAPVMVRFDPVRFRKRRSSNLFREFEIQSILGKRGDVPVPEVLWIEKDEQLLGASFYAMRKIEGRVPSDRPGYRQVGWVVDLDREERKALWESAVSTLAKLHTVPVSELGSLRFDPGDTDDFGQHVSNQRENYLWATDGMANPTVDGAWDWLLTNLPANRPQGITWGDARYGNMMFDGVTCCAVLDWEDVSLGGPLFDLGRWCLSEKLNDVWGHPRLEGMGNREETLALWEEHSGLSSADVRWYELFTACFAAGLTARIAQVQSQSTDAPKAPPGFTGSVLDDIIRDWMDTM